MQHLFKRCWIFLDRTLIVQGAYSASRDYKYSMSQLQQHLVVRIYMTNRLEIVFVFILYHSKPNMSY